ncbi:hypothetical protein [Longimicrobium sp.]|uniref:hypothetical protein n=1 Tax=Longimicrobium sp. TaxID=2029185 RepID=UPI002E33D988|nr:hypothetical protein [Longimicrobium sp.]HEX6040806.1 hypothetical protein [Longimicrobium sp.]
MRTHAIAFAVFAAALSGCASAPPRGDGTTAEPRIYHIDARPEATATALMNAFQAVGLVPAPSSHSRQVVLANTELTGDRQLARTPREQLFDCGTGGASDPVHVGVTALVDDQTGAARLTIYVHAANSAGTAGTEGTPCRSLGVLEDAIATQVRARV